MIAGLVLAAGAGRRFDAERPKQLAPLEGRPLLEHALRPLEASCRFDELVVVLGARADEVVRGVDLGAFRPVVCAAWAQGPAASLRCGLQALGPRADAVVVTLGDVPRLPGDALRRVCDHVRRRGRAALARAWYGDEPGHPVALGRDTFALLLDDDAPVPARELLAHRGERVAFTAGVRPVDVDVHADLSRLDGPSA